MKFLRSILGKKSEEPESATSADTGPDPVLAALAELEIKRLREALAAANPQKSGGESDNGGAARPNRVVKSRTQFAEADTGGYTGGNTGAHSGPTVNIWDLEDSDPVPASSASARAAARSTAARSVVDSPAPERPVQERPVQERSAPERPARERAAPERAEPPAGRPRSRTRVLGFDAPPGDVVALFEAEAPGLVSAPVTSQRFVMFPVGWLVVKSGPGLGNVFALDQGVSQIGRGTDQTVALDFGDMTISRQNHAAIAYDSRTHQFHVGHGGKANLVRLNGKPLLTTEPVYDGDEFQIGETTLMLKVLCTPSFNWTQSEAGGDGHDMAIA